MKNSLYFLIFISILERTCPFTMNPPCCRDHLGQSTCRKMMEQNERMFSRRCNTDAEFRLIQCCSSCNLNGTGISYDLIARSLVSEHCFDRYGEKFCNRYVNKTDVFEPHNTWSCEGTNPQIAFRACRLACGYCNFNLVHYTLENALKACKNTKKQQKSWWKSSRIDK